MMLQYTGVLQGLGCYKYCGAAGDLGAINTVVLQGIGVQ